MLIFTLKQFIRYGVHLGHYKWESDYRLSYFLLGVRNFVHIINIYYTLYALKKSLHIIYNNGLLNQRLLVVNNSGYNLKLNYNKIQKSKLWYINKKWISGLLTNQKSIYLYNKNIFLKFYNLGYFSLLPSYVFVSNIERTSSSIFEAIILNIPNSSMLDSNQGFYGIFYAFNGNDDSFGSINLFNKILIKTILKSFYEQKNFFNKKKKNNLSIVHKMKLFNRYNRYIPYNIKYLKSKIRLKKKKTSFFKIWYLEKDNFMSKKKINKKKIIKFKKQDNKTIKFEYWNNKNIKKNRNIIFEKEKKK